MKRLFALAVAVLLSGCAASAQSPATQGYAYVDVSRIRAASSLRRQLAAYDREIAALRATQAVPQLRDTRGAVARQENVVRDGAHEAVATLDAIRARVKNVTPRRIASSNVTAIEYRSALQKQAAASLALYRSALETRVQTAYDDRAQQLSEHEANLEITLERAVADQRLQLQVKLQNMKPPYVNRAKLRAQLDAIDAHIAAQVDALRARDAATLAEYRAHLEDSAAGDYAVMERQLAANEHANWQVRERVAAAQAAPPAAMPVAAKDADFTRAADDIANRFATIAQGDTSARGDASNEIIALERERATMLDNFHRTVAALAVQLAQSRGLRLDPTRPPGAVDLTPDVQGLVAQLFG